MSNATYLFHNPETGEAYIGATNNVQKRYNEHMRDLATGKHHNRNFQRAFNANPRFDFIPVPVETRQEAMEFEAALLDEYWGNPNLLNLSKDVESFRLGMKDTPETCLKKSLAKKGIPQSAELIEKRAAANRGQKRSEETCALLSACKRGNKIWLGKTHTDEAKAKIAAARCRSVIVNDTFYPSISAASLAHGVSVATGQKRVVSNLPQWANWNYA